MPNGDKASLLPVGGDYREIILRVAAVKDLDIEKLGALLKLQEEWEHRQAATHFNEMKARAEGEMGAISKDSANPATRSRYASLAALDNAIRPIYSKYGFSIDFDEVPYDKEGVAHIVGTLSCGAITKRYNFFVPWSAQGARGGAVSTPTHAKLGAMTYAQRRILKNMWNLAEEDDDGNAAGGRFKAEDTIPEETPSPLDVNAVIREMERCVDAQGLFVYLDSLKGKWGGVSNPDRERVKQRREELLAGFKAGPTEKVDGDHVAV